MRKHLVRAGLACALLVLPVLVATQSAPADGVSARAKQLHDRAIVIDTHADTPQRLFFDKTFDIAVRQKNGNIDIPRMREGGLDAAVLLDLGAERRHRSAGGEARDGSDRRHARSGAPPPRPARAGHHRGGRATRRGRAQDRGADGDGGRPHDRRRHAAAAPLRRARRALHDADAFQEQQLGRLLDRQAGAQRPDRVRQGRRARDEPPGDDGRHLARRGQDLLRRARPHQGAGHRVALVEPRRSRTIRAT